MVKKVKQKKRGWSKERRLKYWREELKILEKAYEEKRNVYKKMNDKEAYNAINSILFFIDVLRKEKNPDVLKKNVLKLRKISEEHYPTEEIPNEEI